MLPTLTPEKQADVLIDLMSYLYPKRRAVEQDVEVVSVAAGPAKNELTRQERCREIARMERIRAALTKDPVVKAALNTMLTT